MHGGVRKKEPGVGLAGCVWGPMRKTVGQWGASEERLVRGRTGVDGLSPLGSPGNQQVSRTRVPRAGAGSRGEKGSGISGSQSWLGSTLLCTLGKSFSFSELPLGCKGGNGLAHF